MTNYELLALLHNVRLELANLDVFIKHVRSIADKELAVMESVVKIAAFDGKQPSHIGNLQSELSNLRVAINALSTRQFFEGALALAGVVKQLLLTSPAADTVGTKLLRELNNLQDGYDAFTRDHNPSKVMSLIVQARIFLDKFDSLDEYIAFLNGAIGVDDEPSVDSFTLDLFMPAYLTFEEFIARLHSINVIYEELCQIFGISTTDHPLKIIKVESGSLWAKVFGQSKVVALMDDFLRGGANFIHRNYTNDGKIKGIPTSVKAMDELFAFREKLQAGGVDVSELDGQISKGALLIAKNMNCLFERQSSVVINGEEIPLSSTADKKLLEARHVPQLSNAFNDLPSGPPRLNP